MLLPQSKAFETLRQRLACISTLYVAQPAAKAAAGAAAAAAATQWASSDEAKAEAREFKDFVATFRKVQKEHSGAQTRAFEEKSLLASGKRA